VTKGILERLAEGPVLGDGGYLLELEKRGYVRAGPFTPEVSLTHPEALAELHREFLLAGAEVLQALTFYASEEKLATVGLAGQVDELNRAAVRIARQVADEGDALVAGNLALTWAYDPADGASPDRVRALFDQQLQVQVDEGIDFVIGETFTWLGEALLAAERARATGLPVMITMAFEQAPHAYEGDDAASCARKLADAGVDIVGLNCLRGPAQTLPLLAEMRAAVPGHHLPRGVADLGRVADVHRHRLDTVPLRGEPGRALPPLLAVEVGDDRRRDGRAVGRAVEEQFSRPQQRAAPLVRRHHTVATTDDHFGNLVGAEISARG